MKKTKSCQFDRLLTLMKENVDIAKNFCGVGASKTNVKEKWEEIGEELNALGPPMRSGPGWQKVWIDQKGKVRTILKDNRREFRATGGGPNKIKQLTPRQQEIDMLLNISASINPSGHSFGCDEESDLNNDENVPPTRTDCEDDPGGISTYVSPAPDANTTDEIDQVPAGPSDVHSTPRRSNRRRAVVEKRNELLRKQTDMQEETVKKNKKIEENTYKIAKNIQKLVDAQIEQNEILKAGATQKAIDNLEKRKLKVRELELKQKQVELKRRELDLKEAFME